MRLIVTRPFADSAALRERLQSLGHDCIASPLLAIEMRREAAIPPAPYQAIALTSANALLHPALHPAPAHLKNVPVHAVGAQSAAAARRAAFTQITAEGGDVAGLAAALARHCTPANGPILYPAGAETSGDLKGVLAAKGFAVTKVVLYDAVPARHLAPEAADAIAQRKVNGVLLYSPRSARIWAGLLAEADITGAARAVRHFCLSQNVAAALGSGFATSIAANPDEASLLALLDRAM